MMCNCAIWIKLLLTVPPLVGLRHPQGYDKKVCTFEGYGNWGREGEWTDTKSQSWCNKTDPWTLYQQVSISLQVSKTFFPLFPKLSHHQISYSSSTSKQISPSLACISTCPSEDWKKGAQRPISKLHLYSQFTTLQRFCDSLDQNYVLEGRGVLEGLSPSLVPPLSSCLILSWMSPWKFYFSLDSQCVLSFVELFCFGFLSAQVPRVKTQHLWEFLNNQITAVLRNAYLLTQHSR